MNLLCRMTQKICQATSVPSSTRLAPIVRSFHGLVASSRSKSIIHRIIASPTISALPNVSSRGYKNVFKGRPLKTKKAAWKRFKLTGKGELKYQPAGKAHLNGTKSRTRLRRLNKKGLLKGAQAKNAKRLIILGR